MTKSNRLKLKVALRHLKKRKKPQYSFRHEAEMFSTGKRGFIPNTVNCCLCSLIAEPKMPPQRCPNLYSVGHLFGLGIKIGVIYDNCAHLICFITNRNQLLKHLMTSQQD